MDTITIYPGSFNPPIPWRNGNHRENNSAKTPECSVGLQEGLIEFRCWIPGVRREDIQLMIRNHRLQLSVCSAILAQGKNSFTTIRYHLDRLLPRLADTVWFTAEYKTGLLTLRFPLAKDPEEQRATEVVVY